MILGKKTIILIALNFMAAYLLFTVYSSLPLDLSATGTNSLPSQSVTRGKPVSTQGTAKTLGASERTLFSRKQPAPQRAEVKTKDNDLEHLTKLKISGIIIEGPDKVAVFLDGKTLTKVREGETVGQWTAKLITRKEVVFSKQEDVYVIPLDSSKNGAQPLSAK